MLKGLELAHLSYGLLPWRKVIEPAVNLAREGFVVSKELASEVSKDLDYESFYGHLNAGDILKLDDVAETLNYVAQYGTSGKCPFTLPFHINNTLVIQWNFTICLQIMPGVL